MSDLIDVLLVSTLLPSIDEKLSATYRVHRFKPDAVPPDVAAKVRAIVATGIVPSALLDTLPKLEIIASVSVGYDAIDVPKATARKIPITNTPDVLNDDVADLAVALMVMASRRLAAADKYVRDGRWLKGNMPLARKASRKRLGIVGLGRIGRDIARRA